MELVLSLEGEAHDKVTVTQELQGQQGILAHCIEQWDISELARVALVSLLKDALLEQVFGHFLSIFQCMDGSTFCQSLQTISPRVVHRTF